MDSLSLVTLMLGLVDRASQIGRLIQTARDEGRDVTEEELDQLVAADHVAREDLVRAINQAKGITPAPESRTVVEPPAEGATPVKP